MLRPVLRLPMVTNQLLSHLRYCPKQPWGFVIYRTTYTPHSNLRFPQLIDTLNANMKTGLFDDKPFSSPDNYLEHFRAEYEMMWARHRPIIMDDPKFNNLSTPEVRSHFEVWVGPQLEDGVYPPPYNNRPQEQMASCLVIDEEVMEELADAKPYRRGDYSVPLHRQWVKAVEAYPDEDGLEHFKVPIRSLWAFWVAVSMTPRLEELASPNGIFQD